MKLAEKVLKSMGEEKEEEDYDFDDLAYDIMMVLKSEIDMKPSNKEYLSQLQNMYDKVSAKNFKMNGSQFKREMSFVNDTTPREQISKAFRKYL